MSKSPRPQKTEKILLLVLLIGSAFFIVVSFLASGKFPQKTYGDLSLSLATLHDSLDEEITSAHLPGSGTNESRQQLNTIFNRLLMEHMSTDERILLSRQGMELLAITREEISRVTIHLITSEGSLEELEKMEFSGNRSEMALLDDYIDRAHTINHVVSTITTLLTRLNDHSNSILKRIIADDGQLTPAHVTDLNTQTPLAEGNFDDLTYSYSRLEKLWEQQKALYREISTSLD